jgi:hypothetical protein
VDISVWPLYALWPFAIQRDSQRNMSSTDTEKFDPSRRRLCPDGACVGLLDESGRCKECGRTASGGPPAPEAPFLVDGEDVGFDAVDPVEAEPLLEESESGSVSGGFDPKRKLCPDDTCVGVIGADGRCSVCGQAG